MQTADDTGQALMEEAARTRALAEHGPVDRPGFAYAVTDRSFLVRLLRYALTKGRRKAAALLRDQTARHWLPAREAERAIDRLSRPPAILALLARRLCAGRTAAMSNVFDLLDVDLSTGRRPPWVTATEIARLNAEIARLRAVELAKLDDERTIADLRIALAVADHGRRGAAPDIPAQPAASA